MPLSHWLRFLCELQHRLLVVQSCPLQQQHLDGIISATSRPRGWKDMAHCCYFFHYHTYSRYSPGGPFHGEILSNQDNRMTNNLYSSSTNGTRKKTLQFYVGTAVSDSRSRAKLDTCTAQDGDAGSPSLTLGTAPAVESDHSKTL